MPGPNQLQYRQSNSNTRFWPDIRQYRIIRLSGKKKQDFRQYLQGLPDIRHTAKKNRSGPNLVAIPFQWLSQPANFNKLAIVLTVLPIFDKLAITLSYSVGIFHATVCEVEFIETFIIFND